MLFLLFLLTVAREGGAECTGCDTPNVRTVLFRHTDLFQECWSETELALLFSRRVIQELVPRTVTCDIVTLLSYIILVLETARNLVCSHRAHRLLMMAIADTFGGYLQAYGIPLTNARYYEGAVSYCTAKQMNDIQARMKKLLDTDGGGWTKPVYVKRSRNIVPLKVPVLPKDVCNNLVINIQEMPKDEVERKYGEPEEIVPLPFLDDVRQPRAIAVPFRDRSLYSLFGKNATDILIRYYTIVLNCIGPPRPATASETCYVNQIEKFVVSYHAWLTRTVLPHLPDDVWYPAFGGVYTITQEMETRGLITPDITYDDYIDSDFFVRPPGEECVEKAAWFNLWMAICLFLFFWVVVANICCLVKYCRKSREEKGSSSSSSSGSSGQSGSGNPSPSNSDVLINNLIAEYSVKGQLDRSK